MFQYSLIHGAYPYAMFDIRSNMLAATGHSGPGVITDLHQKTDLTNTSADYGFSVTTNEVLRRYRLSGPEIEDVLVFSRACVSDVVANTGLAKILEKDYGLTC